MTTNVGRNDNRTGTVAFSPIVLTDAAPTEFLAQIRDVEQAGLERAWTYDHLSWRSLRDGPWFASIPMLAAAFGVTERVRLGTLVATPNFRHPVPFAKEVMTLDHLSRGRLDLGIGAGSDIGDATVLGGPGWPRRERTDRFVEWTDLLAGLLENERLDAPGRYYSAADARMIPGCVQRPRVPLTVAATGRRGMRVAARHAQTWATYGAVRSGGTGGRTWLEDAARQNRDLDDVLAEVAPGRRVRRAMVLGIDAREPLASPGAYDDALDLLGQAGFDELCVHWPRPDGRGLPAGMLDAVLERHRGPR